jgi:hypothetical protein
MTADLEQFEERPRARQRCDAVDQLGEERGLRGPHRVAVLGVPGVAGKPRNELVAAHPDGPMRAPGGNGATVLGKRPVPGQRMLVVAVDERAVDVEDNRWEGHPPAIPAVRTSPPDK